MKALSGKAALVTGASQSIGLASAHALARDGATVVIMGRGQGGLGAARDKLRAELPDATIEMVVGDACDEQDLLTALSFARALRGRLDILVPTVGGAVMQPLLMRDMASFRSEFEVNVVSLFLMIRHGAPLLERDGAIVCISSTAATQAIFGLAGYGAAKAAVDRLVRAAAFELGGAGLRINAVRPGMTVAPEAIDNPAYAPIAAEVPLGRIGMPQDIAEAVRFLAGPESGWVTGQTISVDGGQEQGKYPDNMDAIFGQAVMDRIRSGQPIEDGADVPVYASTSLSPSRN